MFSIKQGDEFSFTVTFANLQEDLTTFRMGVKKDYGGSMLIEKSLGHGISKVSTGKYRIDFTPSETEALSPDMYVYDLRMTIDTMVYTPLYGYLMIEETVFN